MIGKINLNEEEENKNKIKEICKEIIVEPELSKLLKLKGYPISLIEEVVKDNDFTAFVELKGYKATDMDMQCRGGYQYKIGVNWADTNKPIEMCGNGLHFCPTLKDIPTYYKDGTTVRIFECLGLVDLFSLIAAHSFSYNVSGLFPDNLDYLNKYVAKQLTLTKELSEDEICDLYCEKMSTHHLLRIDGGWTLVYLYTKDLKKALKRVRELNKEKFKVKVKTIFSELNNYLLTFISPNLVNYLDAENRYIEQLEEFVQIAEMLNEDIKDKDKIYLELLHLIRSYKKQRIF